MAVIGVSDPAPIRSVSPARLFTGPKLFRDLPVPQFVPKLVAVDAVQFSDPENPPACVRTHYAMGKYRTFEIDSADGLVVWVYPGDWIVTDAANELRRYTAEQFAASFQPIPALEDSP